MAHDVFISYSTKDKPTADAVCNTLEGHGVRCWVAPRDILPGMEWSEAIIDAIEGSRVMLLVFSKNANESPQVRREVERAVGKGVAVVPLRIQDVPMHKALEYFVSMPHWLDALTPPLEQHLVQLAETTKLLLARLDRMRVEAAAANAAAAANDAAAATAHGDAANPPASTAPASTAPASSAPGSSATVSAETNSSSALAPPPLRKTPPPLHLTPPPLPPAPGGVTGIELDLSLPLWATAYRLATPVVALNGVTCRLTWARHFLPAPAGRHTIQVYFAWLHLDRCNEGVIELTLDPGRVARLRYHVGFTPFEHGSFEWIR